jgi:hypothetical protein
MACASKWKLTKKDEADIARQLEEFKEGLPADLGEEEMEELAKEHKALLIQECKEEKKRRNDERKAAAAAGNPAAAAAGNPAPEAPPAAEAAPGPPLIIAIAAPDDDMENKDYYAMVEADVLVIQEKIPGIATMAPLHIVDNSRGDRCGVQAGAFSLVFVAVVLSSSSSPLHRQWEVPALRWVPPGIANFRWPMGGACPSAGAARLTQTSVGAQLRAGTLARREQPPRAACARVLHLRDQHVLVQLGPLGHTRRASEPPESDRTRRLHLPPAWQALHHQHGDMRPGGPKLRRQGQPWVPAAGIAGGPQVLRQFFVFTILPMPYE